VDPGLSQTGGFLFLVLVCFCVIVGVLRRQRHPGVKIRTDLPYSRPGAMSSTSGGLVEMFIQFSCPLV
jgi:hypothetical protein